MSTTTSLDAVPAALTPRGVRLQRPVCVGELCRELGGELDPGIESVRLIATCAPEDAGEGCLVPLFDRRAVRSVRMSPAVLLVDASVASVVAPGQRWVHEHARWVLASLLAEAETIREPAISPAALVEPGVELGARADIGPGAVLLSGARVGDDCRIGPNAVIYGRVRLGHRVVIGAGAVIGRPGFGWVSGPAGQVVRMPQLGGVEIEDDVEVGALATVDAGTLGPTTVRCGCKLDAQVHVGHNVQIGAGTMVAAQTGFAGSSRIGAGVLIGGQVGVADHVVVGDHARLAGKAGVIGNVAPGMTVAGYPAVERMRWLRAIATAMRGRST